MSNIDWTASPRTKKEIAALANAWLDYFDYWNHYVANLPSILEHDLPDLSPEYTFHVKNDSDMKGALATTAFDPLRITLSSSTYCGLINGDTRCRFTAAHELGHFFLHRNDKQLHRSSTALNTKIDARFRSAEWQADTFASNFLMPEHTARIFSSPEDLAQCCQVSLGAAQNRLRELGIWPKSKPIPDLSFLDKYRT